MPGICTRQSPLMILERVTSLESCAPACCKRCEHSQLAVELPAAPRMGLVSLAKLSSDAPLIFRGEAYVPLDPSGPIGLAYVPLHPGGLTGLTYKPAGVRKIGCWPPTWKDLPGVVCETRNQHPCRAGT
jgi:hypothetical protein